MNEYIFTWSIVNFSHSWHEVQEAIVSPKFFASSLYNTAWIAKLYPRGKKNSDYLSLKLCREDRQGPENLSLNIEFSCITADTSTRHVCFIPESSTNFTYGGYSDVTEFCFILRNEVFGCRKAVYLPQNTLTLRCRMWKYTGDAIEFGESFGRTELVIEKAFLNENIDVMSSVEKTFQIKSNIENNPLMSISILCCGDMVDVRINTISDKKMKFATCKLGFVDKRTRRKISELEICFFGKPDKNVWSLPFSEKVPTAKNGNSDKRKCEFTIELVYSTGKENKEIEKNYPRKISEFLLNYIGRTQSEDLTYCSNISEDLRNLVNEQDLCDVELKVETESFHVHRMVLCARSVVFLAMLTHPMKEKESGCVTIEDVSAKTLHKFLDFIYKDTVSLNFRDEAIELYCVADKYQVERLKLLCCSYLLKGVLSVDEICELLLLAHNHKDWELKKAVNLIIWTHDEIAYRSHSWKKFAHDQETWELARETMLSKYDERGKDISVQTYEERLSKLPKIQDDFIAAYKSEIMSDIVIKTENASFRAHKAVLYASSSTMRKMLKEESEDKPTDVLEIKDLQNDIISRILLCLYSDSLGDIQWDIAIKLYIAAVVYKIRKLKIKCSCFLLENLRISNAVDLLLFAHEHGDEKLKSVVKNYISVYDEEIFASDAWFDFCEGHSCLANEIMLAKYRRS